MSLLWELSVTLSLNKDCFAFLDDMSMNPEFVK